MTSEQGVITARFRAVVALALTGWILFVHLHPLHWGKPLPWTWILAGIVPTWAVVIINAAFYGCWLWFGVYIALAPIRKEEKAIWLASIAVGELVPLPHLIPKIEGIARLLRTALCLTAFLGAVAILVSLWNDRARNEPGEI
jgi:hypothetical protein